MNKDYCLVHLVKFKSGFRAEGEIKRVLERKYEYILGTFDYKNGMGLIHSDDKTITTEIVVKKEHYNGAKKNDKVRAKIINYSFRGKIECKVTDVLGNINDAGVDVLSKILQYNVNPIFPDELIDEA